MLPLIIMLINWNLFYASKFVDCDDIVASTNVYSVGLACPISTFVIIRHACQGLVLTTNQASLVITRHALNLRSYGKECELFMQNKQMWMAGVLKKSILYFI